MKHSAALALVAASAAYATPLQLPSLPEISKVSLPLSASTNAGFPSLSTSGQLGLPGVTKPTTPSLPTGPPSGAPKDLPTGLPHPKSPPTGLPSVLPITLPTGLPKGLPTGFPTDLHRDGHEKGLPIFVPSSLPTSFPTGLPTKPFGGFPSKGLHTEITKGPLPTEFPTKFPSGEEWKSKFAALPTGVLLENILRHRKNQTRSRSRKHTRSWKTSSSTVIPTLSVTASEPVATDMMIHIDAIEKPQSIDLGTPTGSVATETTPAKKKKQKQESPITEQGINDSVATETTLAKKKKKKVKSTTSLATSLPTILPTITGGVSASPTPTIPVVTAL